MEDKEKKQYCKHCGEIIDNDCVICPKCGKQVGDIKQDKDNNPFIINNNASSSASASAVSSDGKGNRRLPWYLTVIGMIFLAICTGGFALIFLIPMRLAYDFSR